MTTPNKQLIQADLIRKATDEARQLARMNAGPPLDAPAYLRKAFPAAATAAVEAYQSELAAMGLEESLRSPDDVAIG